MHPEPASCPDCRATLAPRQRYCVDCGARVGPPSPQLGELLAAGQAHREGRSAPAAAAAAAAAASPPRKPPRRSWIPDWNLPRRPISALLVAAFLGFGVLIGHLAASAPGPQGLANASSRLRLVIPSSPTSSTGGGTAGTTGGSTAGSEATPPASESAETPAAEETSTTSTTTSGSKTKSSTKSQSSSGGSTNAAATKLPALKHVFLIMLSQEPYATAFGPASPARYLTGTLEKKGALLVRYDAVAHQQLADELALLTGQGPTAETSGDCPTYSAIAPTGAGAEEQVLGNGCVYPASVASLPGQLTAKHLTWRAYVDGTGEPGTPAPCAHPAIGAADPTSTQQSGAYATFENPFAYLGAIADSSACAREVVGLSSLHTDLARASSTPSFSYIAPDRCHDGSPTPCSSIAVGGMAAADRFLERTVPAILASPAYKKNGLLVITVGDAPSTGEFADSSSCCGQPTFPNVPAAAGAVRPRGGGAVGAVLLSPYIKGGASSSEPYDHFSMLRTIEDLFKLKHLGYAALAGVKPLEPSIFMRSPVG